MSKCIRCGTTWTTAGLALCPVCGEKVASPAEQRSRVEETAPKPAPVAAAAAAPPTRIRHGTTVRIPSDGASAARAMEPPPASPKASVEKTASPEKTAPSEKPVPPVAAPAKAEASRLPRRLIDSSVMVLPAEMTPVPRPERPINGPIILGALALVTVLLLPMTLAFESNRVFGVLGFCMSGFFVPFAPIAWIAGLTAEGRRREQGLEAEPRVVLGRLLGQVGTLLLIGEVTVLLVLVAGLRLAGKLPPTFWSVSL